MRITDNYIQNNTSFKSFKVSFNTAEKLKQLPNGILSDLLDVGKKVDKTEYIDLELLSDLRLRIKEKGNPFSGLAEPISVREPKINENKIKISGIYDGMSDENHKCGDKCEIYIKYTSPKEAVKGYKAISESKSKIERIGNIVKELDSQRIFRTLPKPNERTKVPLYQVLMDKYGDMVREFTP